VSLFIAILLEKPSNVFFQFQQVGSQEEQTHDDCRNDQLGNITPGSKINVRMGLIGCAKYQDNRCKERNTRFGHEITLIQKGRIIKSL
jgi:hypothetical protein